jgi:hypothetical protein
MKTIKEAAREYADNTAFLVDEPHKVKCYKSFVEGVNFVQRWISVEEGLPKKLSCGESEFVLVKDEFGLFSTAYYDYDFDYWANSVSNRYWQKVTHWRKIELE